jgi:hypothetical protein
MKFVSLDLETSTLKPGVYNILSMALVLHTDFRTPIEGLPSLRFLFTCQPSDVSNIAMAMNAPILLAIEAARTGRTTIDPKWASLVPKETFERAQRELSEATHICYEQSEAVQIIKDWLKELVPNGKKLALAGKNIGTFDWQFLCDGIRQQFSHRTIDPGSLYLGAADEVPPDAAECCRRAGLPDNVSHNAYGDAKQVAELVRLALHV